MAPFINLKLWKWENEGFCDGVCPLAPASDPQEGSFSAVKDAKVPWSDEETLQLLDIWGKDSVQRALKGCLKNRHIFTQIAQKMAERGYMRSVEQCQTRIKRLKKYFRQNHRWVSGEEEERGENASALTPPEFFFSGIRTQSQLQDGVQVPPAAGTGAGLLRPVQRQRDHVRLGGVQRGRGGVQGRGRGRGRRPAGPGPDRSERNGYAGSHRSFSPLWGKNPPKNPKHVVVPGTRSVPWTDAETLVLINAWGEDTLQQELRMTHRTGHIFTIISNKMAAQGFSRTPEQCQTRLKRLKLNFRQSYHNKCVCRRVCVCECEGRRWFTSPCSSA